MALKSIEKMPDLNGRIVIVRCDFNVNLKNNAPLDLTKILRTYKTIKYLSKRGATIILLSHLGRPLSGKPTKADKKLSLRPFYNFIKKDFPSLQFITKPIAKLDKHDFSVGSLFLLENIRFYQGEWDNDARFAKQLASLADFYVNEAFADCHRKHASIVAITKQLDSFTGFNLLDEIETLKKIKINKLACRRGKPALIIIGGLKIDNKLKLIETFAKKGAKILLAGGASFLFFRKKGFNLGATNIDSLALREPTLKRLLNNKQILLPTDLIVANAKTLKHPRRVIFDSHDKQLCDANEAIFDVGPQTVLEWSKLMKKAQTIIWAGPAGYVDFKKFSHASVMLARVAASRASGRAFGVVGGGETLHAVELSKMGKYFDYISTGGGALLNFIAGQPLPGIEALNNN
jgi:phosphoglycerate kinase